MRKDKWRNEVIKLIVKEKRVYGQFLLGRRDSDRERFKVKKGQEK